MIAGEDAFQAEDLSDDDLVTKITDILCTIHGKEPVPRPRQFIVTRWGKDPFSKGSHSYGSRDDRDTLSKPVNGVFFAGEATSKNHHNTTVGAFRTGLRAAAEIKEWFIGPPKRHPRR
jgi:monoamine oxidase